MARMNEFRRRYLALNLFAALCWVLVAVFLATGSVGLVVRAIFIVLFLIWLLSTILLLLITRPRGRL